MTIEEWTMSIKRGKEMKKKAMNPIDGLALVIIIVIIGIIMMSVGQDHNEPIIYMTGAILALTTISITLIIAWWNLRKEFE